MEMLSLADRCGHASSFLRNIRVQRGKCDHTDRDRKVNNITVRSASRYYANSALSILL
jgi:hypothetical protein